MIETLNDIIEGLADKIGVYGAHDENESNPCRICWTGNLRDRLIAAFDIERKLYPLAKAESGWVEEYCGKSTTYHLIAGAIYYACMLPPNHDGECQPGGNCVVHGRYVGATQCPKWPECVKGLLASHSQPSVKEK